MVNEALNLPLCSGMKRNDPIWYGFPAAHARLETEYALFPDECSGYSRNIVKY
ncbi:hypothetical protein ACCS60_06250 [Rhizobium acaciae]|uniref:hypothetical protein n=1 Tax=Rhizobium acaciae TaxID=2989736 RepID=UPI003F9D8EA0